MPTPSRFHPERLSALHRVLQGYCERGDIPGIVALIARGDEQHVEVLGTKQAGGREPMQRDTIFRVASITKPIAGAATMMLIDEGKLQLDAAVDQWLPELAQRRVLRRLDSELDDTVPAKRAITVRDVLTFCCGLGSVMARPGTYPIQRPIREQRLGGDGPEYMLNPPSTDAWIRGIGELPLLHQPGERWLYNTSADLLGVLIARVTGKTFGEFLRERVFEPLGMHDTGFSVPADKRGRLPDCYAFDSEQQRLTVFDSAENSAWSRTPVFESGAGGLVSTVDDYFAFCRMMLDKGRSGQRRLLSEAAVEAMTRDQLTPAQREGTEIFLGKHASWGFGVAVDIAADHDVPGTVPGRFGWDGGLGTSAYSDPKNDFVGILFTQRLMDSPDPPPVFTDFWEHAYRALEG
ncbi:MAG: serine hydrolase domain-containing protein [Polyangiales bacterium]